MRKVRQVCIGSLEKDLKQARSDLSAIIATECLFQSRDSNVKIYMGIAALFPRRELPRFGALDA
jgi:hypothetical protein